MRKYLLFMLLLAGGIATQAQEVNVYLIGDAGKPLFPEDATLDYLEQFTSTANPQDALIFLGDNLYPSGLPPREHPDREEMEKRLDASLKIMKSFPGKSFIIPGNHDWANGGKDGWQQLLQMQQYVDDYMGTTTVFLPRSGCPGPVEIDLSPEILLVIMDTQYLLHPWDKPGENEGCEAISSTEALLQLEDLLGKNAHRNVIVAGHHPMYSYGPHGGKYTFRQHLFPLTDVNRKLWIPLPVIGSIYPLFRTTIGSRQDIPNPRYKLIRNAMVDAMEQVPELVFVNGHEHSLQYIAKNNVHYITSGAGSKSSNISGGPDSRFHRESQGFARLTYQTDGPVRLAFYDGGQQQEVYNEQIFDREIIVTPPKDFNEVFEDSTVVVPISDRYTGASKARKYWLGPNYREVWATPVTMPVFNIGSEHGGLDIVKLGGGNQTKSLRLEAKDGRQYVLRSLDKYTEKLLPTALYQSLVADIIQDQISAANPFGAFAIPPLAEAAGIYHTNPKLVYVPDDPRFGPYQPVFAGLPVLYEERPNDEVAHEPFFGGGEDVDGTPDLIEELHDDNDEAVDQEFALRNRLFDMIIGDWDRHEDQWRWVRFDKEPKGHLWRPIPRDRDQAFFVNEGLFGWAASRKFLLPNTEGFDERMDYPPGFNASARFFDRTFLNELDWSDWQQQIDRLEAGLTDEAIEKAFTVWPDTIRKQSADRTIRTLKARRDDMARFARIHYEFISQEVEVVGSNKHEYFLVERLDNGDTKVIVQKRKKDGELEQVLYERTFLKSVTKEIRLYGLEGEDVFEVTGDADKGITVHIIGGEDEDRITDQSRVAGLGKKTKVYDLKSNTELSSSGETRSKLSRDISVNRYNRTAFEYSKMVPLVSVQFNRDDGLFLGGGFIFTKEGWRKDPFAQKHQFQANAAFATGAVNLFYNGTFSDVIGKWDLNADLSFQRPFAVANFFGMGNESQFDYEGEGVSGTFEDEIDYYRIRYERSQSYVNISRNLGNKGTIRFGPEHLFFEQEGVINKYLNVAASGGGEVDSVSLYESRHFIGAKTVIEVDTRDHQGMPTRGVFAHAGFSHYYGMNDFSDDFSVLQGEFRFLLSTKVPSRLVLANRVGARHTFGSVEYFNGAFLGKETLRGYRRTRFIGNSFLYHNVDLRLHLFNFRTYLLPAGVGLIAFHDIGRVWLAGEDSNTWHASKGFGIWLAPLNQIAITANLAFSDEETLPTVTFGYQF
jgi:hypothetical protein